MEKEFFNERERQWESVRSVLALRRQLSSGTAREGSAPTLFLLDYLYDLSKYIKIRINVLTIKDCEITRFSTIESMASNHVAKIRSIQSVGPYFLGGQCARGVLAFEIAQQLRAQDQEVAFLALIDTNFPKPAERFGFFRHCSDRVVHHLREMAGLNLRAWPYYGISKIYNMYRLINSSLSKYKMLYSNYWQQIISAKRNYVPRPYPGRIILFLASDYQKSSSYDLRFKWREIAECGCEINFISGDHHTMIREPFVKILANSINKYFDLYN